MIEGQTQDQESTDKTYREVKDRSGHVYKSQAEKMMYFMRRKRGSDLPHWPTTDPNANRR